LGSLCVSPIVMNNHVNAKPKTRHSPNAASPRRRLLLDCLELGAEINLKNAERVHAPPRRAGARRRRGHPPAEESA
jgi:hypothetical protein